MRRTVLWLSAIVVFVILNFMIYQKEKTISEGTTILLELAPVDPRSMMQGDYMMLQYAMARMITDKTSLPKNGKVVVTLDSNNIAGFKRFYNSQTPHAKNEHLLKYRKRGDDVRLGAESYFFQEGHAEYYSNAKYGELRVSKDGDSVLVGLRDKNLIPLHPPVK